MEDHRLGDLLRELPREHARAGFTARVLDRLAEPESPTAVPRLALAGALATLLVVGGSVLTSVRREAAEADRAQQALRQIRAEHLRLAQEVRDLSAPPPVVYLGGNEKVDLVLDLGKVGGSEGATPVAYHGETF